MRGAAPCTAVGLCLVAPAFLFGATARVVDGAIEVALSSFKSSNVLLGALPFNAITFGHVVLATSQTELDRLRAHEQAPRQAIREVGSILLCGISRCELLAVAEVSPSVHRQLVRSAGA